jgi:hypothetical protein
MQRRKYGNPVAAFALLASFAVSTAQADVANIDVTKLATALERARHEMAVKQDKMARYLDKGARLET